MGDGDVVEAPAGGAMSVEVALQEVLKKSLIHDGLARGLRESVKALDKREAFLCVLSKKIDEAAYSNLIQVEDSKLLGQWAGLCKLDREGNARKVVGCGCVVVRDYGEQSEAMNVLLEYFKTR